MKIYSNVCNKHRKFKKKLEYYIFLKEVFLLFTVSVVMNMKKIFKEKDSIEILKIVGLIANIEEYQKLHNHV